MPAANNITRSLFARNISDGNINHNARSNSFSNSLWVHEELKARVDKIIIKYMSKCFSWRYSIQPQLPSIICNQVMLRTTPRRACVDEWIKNKSCYEQPPEGHVWMNGLRTSRGHDNTAFTCINLLKPGAAKMCAFWWFLYDLSLFGNYLKEKYCSDPNQ